MRYIASFLYSRSDPRFISPYTTREITREVKHYQYILVSYLGLKQLFLACFVQGKSEVVLCKKKLEDFTQRWVIAEDG